MENVLNKVREMTGLGFEDLDSAERETVMKWANAVGSKEVTVSDLRDFFQNLRMQVDMQLASHNLSKEEDFFLKARLKNLIALERFLEGPKKIQEALDMYLKSLKK